MQQLTKPELLNSELVVNEYNLDKESTSYDDIFDATRLSLKAFSIN